MDIFVYNTDEASNKLKLKGVIDTVERIVWKRRFIEGDEFEITMPCTEKNLKLVTEQTVVEVPERYSGIVTEINLSVRKGVCILKAKGCSFDGMLERRVLIKCSSSDSVMTVLDKNAGEAADDFRRFPAVKFDFTVDCTGMNNYGYLYGSLSSYIKAAGRDNGFCVCSELVHEGCEAYIRIYGRYGADRSVEQSENTQLVYTDVYENMSDGEYHYSEKGAMTGAFVYSEAKQIGEYTVESWNNIYSTDSSGYERCEKSFRIEPQIVYVPVASGSSIIYVPELDKDASESYGQWIQKKNYSSFKEDMRSVIILKSDGVPFEIGDKITVHCSRFDKLLTDRVYEIIETYSGGNFTVTAVTGKFAD